MESWILKIDDRPAMEPGRRVTHRHGMHGPHVHSAADYAEHQRPIDDEEVLAPGLTLPRHPALPYVLQALARRTEQPDVTDAEIADDLVVTLVCMGHLTRDGEPS